MITRTSAPYNAGTALLSNAWLLQGQASHPVRCRVLWPAIARLVLAVLCAVLSMAAPARAAFVLIGFPINDADTQEVVEHYSLMRHLQPVRVLGTQQVLDWLLDRPPLAATLARHLHPPLERYHVTDAGNAIYKVDDGGALRGHLRPVAQDATRRVYYCDGQFRSLAQLLKLSGRMVFTLQFRQVREAGEPSVEVEPQLFVRLDNILVHGVLKVIGPLLDGIIDRRVASLTAAAKIVGRRLQEDPQGIYREMKAWPDVSPQELEEFRLAFRLPKDTP